MKQLILVALIGAMTANAQQSRRNNTFTVCYEASLSGADATLTVQQPASGSKWVELLYAEVRCSVACVVTMLRDGTAATASAATEVSANGGYTPAVTAFTASDVGAGTTVFTYNVAAGETVGRSLDGFFLEDDDSTANNFSIDTDDITGDARLCITGREW